MNPEARVTSTLHIANMSSFAGIQRYLLDEGAYLRWRADQPDPSERSALQLVHDYLKDCLAVDFDRVLLGMAPSAGAPPTSGAMQGRIVREIHERLPVGGGCASDVNAHAPGSANARASARACPPDGAGHG